MKKTFNIISIFEFYILYLIFFLYPSNAISNNETPVVVTGDNVRSKLDYIKNNKKYYITEITGNPKVKYKDKELLATKIVIRGREGEIIEGIGNVRVIDKLSNSIIRSKKAIYYKERGEIEILGNPSIKTRRRDDKSFVYLNTKRIIYNIEKDIANAYGNIYLKNRDTRINSEQLIFERQNKKMIFLENPVMRRGEDILKASEIVYPIDKKSLYLNRDAQVITFSETKDSKNGEIKKTKITAKGDRIEHYEEDEELTVIAGNAIIDGDETVLKGDRIEIYGEKPRLVVGSRVSIDYLPDNVELYGENLRYNPLTRYSELWGNALIVIKEDQTLSGNSKIYGSYMEYFQDIDELNISGEVKILNDSEIIQGDMARYIRKYNNLYITGNSKIEKGNSIIFADAIIYNMKDHNTRIAGDIRGIVLN